jgi:SAM-dependent methyltransferase
MKSEFAPTAAVSDHNAAVHWDQAHRYTPAPRHRRRLLFKLIKRLNVSDVLDAGCAQPLLVKRVIDELGIPACGCDISDRVMEQAAREVPRGEFRALDLAHEVWPDGRQFDLVVCSETLEHIADWKAAIANLVVMSSRYVLITVPSGKVRPVDELMGHYRHFEAGDISRALEDAGCETLSSRYWGFPVHSAYRAAVDRFGSDKVYASFAEDKPYSTAQKGASHLLYGLFYANDLFHSGSQLIVLARKRSEA